MTRWQEKRDILLLGRISSQKKVGRKIVLYFIEKKSGLTGIRNKKSLFERYFVLGISFQYNISIKKWLLPSVFLSSNCISPFFSIEYSTLFRSTFFLVWIFSQQKYIPLFFSNVSYINDAYITNYLYNGYIIYIHYYLLHVLY